MGNTFSTRADSDSHPRKTKTKIPQLLEPVHKGFNPTRQDVQIAVRILMGLQLQAVPGHLPSELALSILAHADYRPRITSSCARLVVYHAGGARPWYLTTPTLPPDFGRATSITLQVRSEDRWEVVDLDGVINLRGTNDHRQHTWFEMCILRPLRRAPPSPPSESGYVLRGCVLTQEPELVGVQMSPERPRGTAGDADEDFGPGDQWLVVNHNGRETWVIHYNRQASCGPWYSVEELVNGVPVSVRHPREGCETYRVDFRADDTPNVEDPHGFIDGEGFLSALMPGDKIALWATAEDPVSWIMVTEAVLEIVYDISI